MAPAPINDLTAPCAAACVPTSQHDAALKVQVHESAPERTINLAIAGLTTTGELRGHELQEDIVDQRIDDPTHSKPYRSRPAAVILRQLLANAAIAGLAIMACAPGNAGPPQSRRRCKALLIETHSLRIL